MESTGRFLVGGALGAALGYLLSQKGQSGQEAGLGAVSAPAPLSVPAAPAVTAAPPLQAAPVPPAPFTPAPSPTPFAPTPAPFAPALAPLTPTPSPVPPEPFAPAPAAPVPFTPTPSPVPPSPTPVMREPEPEVIFTREFLEEPLPGAGWTPSAPSALEDETIETPFEPMQEIPVIEVPVAAAESLSQPVEIAAPGVEQTVEHITLEEPTIESVMIEEVVEPPLEQIVESSVVEERASDVMGPGTAGTEALVQAADVMGRLPVTESPPAESSRVDDLKSRIEETRRRIRHELEQPFETSSFGRSFESDWTSTPAVPDVAKDDAGLAPSSLESPILDTIEVESLPVEPAVMETIEVQEVAEVPLAMEAPVAEPAAAIIEEITTASAPLAAEPPAAEPGPESLELDTTLSDADVTSEVVMEEPVDYDSMKNRIESTRSRLKAKAFDAMMTGESALLGRDLEGATASQGNVSGVDEEVDETIETSLREEEE